MICSDANLIRKAFVIKYGYTVDLNYDELVGEFRRRYDQAQILQQQEVGLRRLLHLIEGIPESATELEAVQEREIRNLRMQRLSEESSYGRAELIMLAEEFAARLEAEWIRIA
jgi:hypothetical protein